MTTKQATKTHVQCKAAELVGFDVIRGGLLRPGLPIQPHGLTAITAALNNAQATIIRPANTSGNVFTHVVNWPGVGFLLCNITAVTLASSNGKKGR